MAKRNSMSTARRSRNRKQEPVPQNGNTAATQSIGELTPEWAPQSKPADVAQVISGERNRLMKAQAVLRCVAFALLYEDWLKESNRPSFADAIEVAEELIRQTIDRIESC